MAAPRCWPCRKGAQTCPGQGTRPPDVGDKLCSGDLCVKPRGPLHPQRKEQPRNRAAGPHAALQGGHPSSPDGDGNQEFLQKLSASSRGEDLRPRSTAEAEGAPAQHSQNSENPPKASTFCSTMQLSLGRTAELCVPFNALPRPPLPDRKVAPNQQRVHHESCGNERPDSRQRGGGACQRAAGNLEARTCARVCTCPGGP